MVNGRGERPSEFFRPTRNRPAGRGRSRLSGSLHVVGLVTLIAVTAIAAYGGYRFAMHSDTFLLREIAADEVSPELRDEVRQSLSAALGQNLLLLDLEVLRRRVETIARVSEAQVRRVLPDSVEVTVTLRRPFAAVVRDDVVLVIDQERVLLDRRESAPDDLPVLRIETPIEISPETARVEAPSLPDALAVIDWLQRTPPETIRDIDHVRVSSQGVVLVVVVGQLEIVFGDASDLGTKVANLTALYRSEPPVGARQVDVSFRDMVVVRDLNEG